MKQAGHVQCSARTSARDDQALVYSETTVYNRTPLLLPSPACEHGVVCMKLFCICMMAASAGEP